MILDLQEVTWEDTSIRMIFLYKTIQLAHRFKWRSKEWKNVTATLLSACQTLSIICVMQCMQTLNELRATAFFVVGSSGTHSSCAAACLLMLEANSPRQAYTRRRWFTIATSHTGWAEIRAQWNISVIKIALLTVKKLAAIYLSRLCQLDRIVIQFTEFITCQWEPNWISVSLCSGL